MQNIQLTQADGIVLPRWKSYSSSRPSEYFDLRDAKSFLDRWQVDTEAMHGWEHLYDQMRKNSKEKPQDARWALDNLVTHVIQKRFGKAILDSLTPDFREITQHSSNTGSTYYLLSNISRGVLVLSEPHSQYHFHPPYNRFELGATDGIDLPEIARQINAYLDQNWKLPVEAEGK